MYYECMYTCICYMHTYSNINEDKRKTEKQMLLFEVVKEIEDCPVSQPHHSIHVCMHNGFFLGEYSILYQKFH